MNLKYYLRGLGIGILVTALIMGFAVSGNSEQLSDTEIIERARALGMVEDTQVLADLEVSEADQPTEADGQGDGATMESDQEDNGDTGGLPDGAMAPTNSVTPGVSSSPGRLETTEAPTVSPNSSPSSVAASPSTSPAVNSTPNAIPSPSPTRSPVVVNTPDPTRSPVVASLPSPLSSPVVAGSPTPTNSPAIANPPAPTTSPGIRPEDSTMITIVIYSGDSSVAVSRRLEAAGLVPSAVRYDRYLCDNDYDKILRVGTYEIPEGADDETIAEIITRL